MAWSCCTFCRASVTTLKGEKQKTLFIFPRYGKSIHSNCSGVRSVWNKLWQPCIQPGCKQVNTRQKFQLCQSRLWSIPANHPFRIHVDLSRLLVRNYIVFTCMCAALIQMLCDRHQVRTANIIALQETEWLVPLWLRQETAVALSSISLMLFLSLGQKAFESKECSFDPQVIYVKILLGMWPKSSRLHTFIVVPPDCQTTSEVTIISGLLTHITVSHHIVHPPF